MSDYAHAMNEGTNTLTTFVVGHRTLDGVARLACETVPGASVGGLTLLRNGRLTTSVLTDPTSPEIDVQHDADAGPCIVAGEPVGALDLYPTAERAFDEAQEGIGAGFAAQAYWEANEVADQLHEAMSRAR